VIGSSRPENGHQVMLDLAILGPRRMLPLI
jgi:hypothetical protein